MRSARGYFEDEEDEVGSAQMLAGFAAGEGFHAVAVCRRGRRGRGAIVFREVAEPPGDGFLDEPLGVVDVSRGPAEDAVAWRRSSPALGWFCFVQGSVITSAARRVHMCGEVVQGSTSSRRDGSATRRFWPAMAGVVGDGPGVEIGHPGGDQPPDRSVVRADAGLGQQLGGGDAGLVDVGVPRARGESERGRRG